MVQLTYEEMNCIRGGISPVAVAATVGTPAATVTADLAAAAPADEKRTPRPGSGGVSTS